ncbi:MAG: PorP/SprF family type IX secretion system membrane protein [Bacteroidetes bacterium]|nr:PorP/SprF family type IX secretion system membrane protein [Bacteroidota bacterium]
MKAKFLIIIIVLSGLSLGAQQLPYLNQYLINPYLANPAMAGRSEGFNIYGLYKHQWDNMPDAPRTGLITGDTRLMGSNHAVGALVSFDKSNLLSNFSVQGTYAYHLPFNKKKNHGLSLGLTLGLLNQTIDFQKANVLNPNDPFFSTNNANSTSYDIGLGLNYFYRGLNIGIACPQVFNNFLAYKNDANIANFYHLERQIFSSISMAFKMGPNKGSLLTPLFGVRYFKNTPLQYDAQLMFNWRESFWMGVGYRSAAIFARGGAHATAGVRIMKSASISYNFEMPVVKDMNFALGNTHEIMFGYRIGKSKRMEDLEKKMDTMGFNQRRLKRKLDESYEDAALLKNELDSLRQALGQSQAEIAKGAALTKYLSERNSNTSTNANGATVNYKKLGEVFFSKNVFSLDATAKAQLDALAESLKGKGTNNILYVIGNASQEGNANYNLILATKRASFAKKYLMEKGALNFIIITSVGAEDPSSDKDMQKNRRVDFFIAGE